MSPPRGWLLRGFLRGLFLLRSPLARGVEEITRGLVRLRIAQLPVHGERGQRLAELAGLFRKAISHL